MAQLVAALKGRLLTASPRATTSLAGSAFRSARAYSRKTKTKYEVEASELKSDIAKLQKAIADQERQLAAKKAYEESILRQNERINAASTVYRELMKPQAPPAPSTPSLTAGTPTARLPDNPNAKSFLPGTFLEDLRLTFLDTRGAKEEKLRQLQSGLLSMEDLKAITPDSVHAPSETTTGTLPEAGAMVGEMAVSTELEAKVEDAVVFERVRALDVTQWNNLVYVNALEGRPDKAEQVLKLMEEVGVSPTVETFDHLLEAYANHGDLAKAQGTIDLIIKNGLTPSLSSYNSLISIHVAQRDLMGAFRTFDALKQHHAPDTAVFTNLVKGCLLAEEYDLGWKIFDQMQHSGAPPDESTYSMMIRACAKTDQVERALDIFRQYPTRRLHPTDKTFNSLIHACAVRKEYFTTAFALLNEMQNVYGFEPDILTYNTLLFACSKRQDLMTARRIFQKVVQLDHEGHLELDGITVTNFLWCVTEWKNTDLHHKRYKYRVRNERNKRLEEAAGKQEDVTAAAAAASSTLPLASNPTTTTDTLAIRSDYLLLSKIPPMDEMEALAEGEKVFSWFIARAAERHPPPPPKTLESQPPSPTEHGDPATSDPSSTTTNSSDATTLTSNTATTTTASDSANPTTEDILRRLPRINRAHTPIRTRLLNAYLAMYVRHNEIPTAKDIYNRFFRHFQQPRDSWTFATMLEGCYFWKDVDFGSQVFRDWRAWRLSTGKVTEKRYRRADYDVYRRTVNLLARTNHLREALALLEELSKTATGEGGGILALQAKEVEQEDHIKADDQAVEAVDAMPRDKELEDLFDTSTSSLDHPSTSSSSSTPTSSSSSPAASTSLSSTTASKFSFLTQVDDATVLPIYPRLQDFPAVYTKTWELEDEPARRYLLSLCSGGIETLNPGRGDKDKNKEKERADNKDEQPATAAAAAEAMGKRRHDKSLRKLALRWKGEHHHPDDRRGGGLYIGERRRRELEQDTSKRGWGRK
ncbi:hypothetical protein DFQ26_002049 [Actinomortierella ambigua]|nr:hypothetical protein DFQ26_002049 [Actinomortierella ambigua]